MNAEEASPADNRSLESPRHRGSAGGAADRAVARWAWRLFRREWRQQVLVLSLLTAAVAAMTFVAAAAYGGAESPEFEFGTSDLLFRLDAEDAEFTSTVAIIENEFGSSELVASNEVGVPGSTDRLELRRQEINGEFTAPLVELRAGQPPAGASDLAVTASVVESLGGSIGDRVTLDGVEWLIVGLVENPLNLRERFALVAADDQGAAITCPATSSTGCLVEVFVRGDDSQLQAVLGQVEGPIEYEWKPPSTQAAAAAAVFALAAVMLLLVALVAAAAFVVIAQRRQRQLGMLAAVGATTRQLRLVTITNGAIVGIVAAAVGTAIALPLWIVTAPQLERIAGRRIDPFAVPWWLIAAGMALAVITATGAAWWPARTVARLPISIALSARAPRPKPARRSGLFALLAVAAGIGLLTLGEGSNILLVVVGTLSVVAGLLMTSPLILQLMGRAARWFSVAPRLALRDLSRYRTRSAAALAAIGLALGLPAATVVVANAAEYAADEGNLSATQAIAHIGDWYGANVPVHSDDELHILDNAVNEIGHALGAEAAVIGLDMAVQPNIPAVASRDFSEEYRTGVTTSDGELVYIATDELLAYYGLKPSDLEAEVLTTREGEVTLESQTPKGNQIEFVQEHVSKVQLIETPQYTSTPLTLITKQGATDRGWVPVRARWLIDAQQPTTNHATAQAHTVAASNGLTVETRDTQAFLGPIRTGATAIGMVVALGVLAMTMGLIRGESANDIVKLTATGATTRVRRSLSATTTGSLALIGALLGATGSYLILAVGYLPETESLYHSIPFQYLIAITVGVPAVAYATAWTLTRRQIPHLARSPID